MSDLVKKPKLLVFDQLSYAQPYKNVFDVIFADSHDKLMNGMEECDVVLFTGGSDVSPHLYNEPEGTYTNPSPHRDKFEKFVWDMASNRKKGKLGICRGMQLAVVMAGGKLIQHTTGHTGGHHLIEDVFGNSLMMTSVHHQMVRPETVTHCVVVAWNKSPSSAKYLDGFEKEIYLDKKDNNFQEPEVVWLPKERALGIQGHPEMSDNPELHNYCNQLIEYYLLGRTDIQPKYRIEV